MANQRYFGQYHDFFDDKQEQPIPIWHALASILEDYAMSKTEPIVADMVYKRMCGPWFFEPPPAVQVHLHFCPCERRHKWTPNATIASVEYNWPQISGAL